MYQDYKDLLSAFHAHGVKYWPPGVCPETSLTSPVTFRKGPNDGEGDAFKHSTGN
jgi:hypothetical protein